MSDLREKMLKAGLITEAQATRVEPNEPRPREPQDGGGPRGDGGGGRRRGGRGRGRDGRRAGDGQGVSASPADPEARAEASRVAEAGRIEIKNHRGGRRWYYVSRGGLVPFVELPEDVAEQLGRGDVALVEAPDGATWLVARQVAQRLAQLDREWLRAFNIHA